MIIEITLNGKKKCIFYVELDCMTGRTVSVSVMGVMLQEKVTMFGMVVCAAYALKDEMKTMIGMVACVGDAILQGTKTMTGTVAYVSDVIHQGTKTMTGMSVVANDYVKQDMNGQITAQSVVGMAVDHFVTIARNQVSIQNT